MTAGYNNIKSSKVYMATTIASHKETCRKKIEEIAQANPDLSYQFIKDILTALQEVSTKKLSPYPKHQL